MSSAAHDSRAPVLVGDELGLEMLADHPLLRPVLFDLDSPPDDEQRSARIMVVTVADPVKTHAYIRQLPGLELLQALSAGYEQWAGGRLPEGVRLANIDDVHGRIVAELTLALLLAHHRRIQVFAEAQREGRWAWQRTDTMLEKHVTILGAGDIARRLRAMLLPLDCTVQLVGRTARDDVITLEQFLPAADETDVVVLALPDSESTRGIVDAAFLARLRDGALLVNVGRGTLIDTDALVAETGSGRLQAILDVTDPEPLPDGHPLWSARGITITPHVGGAIPDTWTRAWRSAIPRLEAFVAGSPAPDLSHVS